jgi:hypothetical protein
VRGQARRTGPAPTAAVLTTVHTIRGSGGAGPLLVMSARNQEKPNSSPGLALLETASPLRLMGPKWSALGCPHHAFIGKAALPDIGLQCSQPHHGSEHGQRRPNAVLAVAGHDRARPTLQNPTFTGACPQDDAGIRPDCAPS